MFIGRDLIMKTDTIINFGGEAFWFAKAPEKKYIRKQ